MKQKNLSKTVAAATTKVLNNLLRVEANSTTCALFYQPKAPKELARFRREK